MNRPTEPWAIGPEALATQLNVDPDRGLGSLDADKRLEDTGDNRITQSTSLDFKGILLEELREPMVILLLVIGVLYSIWGGIGDAITILLIIVALVLVEVYLEFQARKGIEALHQLAQPTTWVLRDGRPLEVETVRLVPGDMLILKRGVRVGADARVISARGLEADESHLTGEPMGAPRRAVLLPSGTALIDRVNMVHMGGVILKGQGLALVVATGMDTELGRIAGLTQETHEPRTPLQRDMRQLARGLVWLAVFFSLLIPLLGILRGLPPEEMILTGLSLAFATIPEELPIIVTMMLGIGALSLSRHGVLIRRTRAAETLGSVTVIATDKTGTLTENRMQLVRWHTHDVHRLFQLGALTADTVYDAFGNYLGDPMDKAIAEQAAAFGIDRLRWQDQNPLIEDLGFSEDTRTYEAVYSVDGHPLTVIRGAPESVMARSAPNPQLQAGHEEAVADGYRTIAIASRRPSEKSFTLEGLFSFDDPVRSEVPDAVAACTQSGVRVIMITGDHPATARRVAQEAGIRVTGVLTGDEMRRLTVRETNASVRGVNLFARVTPAQKLALVNRLRENGEVVAVTGDGISDAPALKAADIGISMGRSGTDVAREAADMVLADDSFAAFVTGIREGRRLHENLAKAVMYYLACKLGLILIFLVPVLFDSPLPFTPLQIILLELFLDLAASLSFISEPLEHSAMLEGPRDPREPFLDGRMLLGILAGSLTLAGMVLLSFFIVWTQSFSQTPAQTYAFVTWLFGHVALAFHMRTRCLPLTRSHPFGNRSFNVWAGGVLLFVLVAVYTPGLNSRLGLEPVGLAELIGLALLAVVGTVWLEVRKIRKAAHAGGGAAGTRPDDPDAGTGPPPGTAGGPSGQTR